MKNRWYSMSVEKLEKIQQTDVMNGLTSKEADNRIKSFGLNNIYRISGNVSGNYMFHAFANLLAFLLAAVCGIEAVIKRSFYSLIPVVIIAVSLSILYLINVRSKSVMEKMAKNSLPMAKVFRDGRLISVRQDMIVPGDIINISVGDIVPADARLFECEGLTVLEKGVCKTSTPVSKSAAFRSEKHLMPEECENMVFASTLVLNGKGKAIVVETGRRCHVTSSGNAIAIYNCDNIGILESFRRVSNIVSTVMIALVFAITVCSLIFNWSMGIYAAFYQSAVLAFSSLAEFLPVFAVIIVSCGIFGAGNKKHGINSGVDIKNADKIRTIKDVDCIAFHKEALFSREDERLTCILANGSERPVKEDDPNAVSLITYAVVACGIYGGAYKLNKTEPDEAGLMSGDEHIIALAEKCGVYDKRLDEKFVPVFSGQRSYKGREYRSTTVKTGGRYDMYSASQGEAAMAVSSYEIFEGKIIPLTAERKAELIAIAREKMKENCLTVAITYKKGVRGDYIRPGENYSDNVFCGYLYIERPMLTGGARLIKLCRENGIKLVMFCEKTEANDYLFANAAGIARNRSEYVDIKALSEMSDDMIRTNVDVYTVYSGLNSKQRRYVIERLKNDYGYTVAYMGHELSHLSSMLTANVGIAEKGRDEEHCEALKLVSDAVVSPPDTNGVGGMNSAVRTIVEAKGIFKNLTSMCRYLLATFTFRAVLTVISWLTGNALFTMDQLVFLGAICDMGAVALIAFERHDMDVIGWQKRDKESGKRTFAPIAPYFFISVLWSLVVVSIAGTPIFVSLGDRITCVMFISYIISQMVLLTEVAREDSMFKGRFRMYTVYPVYFLVIALFFLVCVMFPSVGAYTGVFMPEGIEWALAFIIPAVLFILIEFYKLVVKLVNLIKNKKRKPQKKAKVRKP